MQRMVPPKVPQECDGPAVRESSSQSEPGDPQCSFKDLVKRIGTTPKPGFDASSDVGPSKKEELKQGVQHQTLVILGHDLQGVVLPIWRRGHDLFLGEFLRGGPYAR